jgi:hypothetical protein
LVALSSGNYPSLPAQPPVIDGMLEGLTCLEAQVSESELGRCHPVRFGSYLEERFTRRLASLIEQSTDRDWIANLTSDARSNILALSTDDYMTQFRYAYIGQVSESVRAIGMTSQKKNSARNSKSTFKASH